MYSPPPPHSGRSVGVYHFVTQNEPKANYAKKCVKTVKHKLFRYLLKARSHRYVNVLSDIARSYNNTEHQYGLFIYSHGHWREFFLLFFKICYDVFF